MPTKSIASAWRFAMPLLLAAGLLAALFTRTWAQPAPVPPADIKQGADQGGASSDLKQGSGGVTVGDSLEAQKGMQTAAMMERQRDWPKAAEWYQEVLEKYRQKLVPIAFDKDSTTNYASVPEIVREALRRWPKEGIDAYRARYEPAAAAMLQQAGPDEAGALTRILSTYFITESSKTAALRLIDLYIESGDFPAAAWVGDLLLKSYPKDDLVVERPRVLQRTALAYHLCGNDAAAAQKMADLRKFFPDAIGAIFGQDVKLVDDLDKVLQTVAPVANNFTGDTWPTFCGSYERGGVAAVGGRASTRFYGIELLKTNFRKNLGAQQIKELQNQENLQAGKYILSGIMPAFDGGGLYFQDGSHVYAISLESGVPLAGWAREYPGERPGVFTIPVTSSPRTQQNCVTLTDKRLLAVMGASIRSGSTNVNMGFGWGMAPQIDNNNADGTRLVCLDKNTGKLQWEFLPPKAFKDENLRGLDLCGAPVVVEDNVFVVAHGGKDMQYENCYVLCLDLANGHPRWSCFVAAAAAAINFNPNGQQSAVNFISHLAYSSGRVYAMSNVGALACVDAYAGTILWLSLYPRDQAALGGGMNPMMGMQPRRRPGARAITAPWHHSPLILQDGRLFSIPADAAYMFVHDAGDGRELMRIPISVQNDAKKGLDLGKIAILLAVDGPTAFLCGENVVFAIKWKEFVPGNAEASLLWRGTGAACGRGFVTSDSVFVPTANGLYRYDRKNGKIVESYPRRNETAALWENTGNVLATNEHVVVAGEKGIEIFTDVKLARAKLQREQDAAPGDPAIRLRGAEIEYAANEMPATFGKLDEAIEVLGGAGDLRRGAARERLFADTLLWAQKAAGEKDRVKKDQSNELAARFFDLARTAADGDAEQVNYRISRGKFANEIHNFPEAVILYQEILAQSKLRVVPLADEANSSGGGVQQAGRRAERLIADIVKVHPEAYESVETQAAAVLDAARQQADPDKLLAVAQTYPNSKAAPQAMLAASAAYELAGNSRLATHVLVQDYRKYSADRGNVAEIVEAMARNYLNAAAASTAVPALAGPVFHDDDLGIAIRRLQKGAAKFASAKLQKPLKLPGGAVLEGKTFAEALDAVQKLRVEPPQVALPDLHLGLKPAAPFTDDSPRTILDSATALLAPPRELREFSRSDRLVVASSASLVIINLDAANAAAPISVTPLKDAAQSIAWNGGNLLAWNGQELALVQPQKAGILWRMELKAQPRMEVVSPAGPGDDDASRDAAPGRPPQGRIIIQGNQRLLVGPNGVVQLLGLVNQTDAPQPVPAEEQIAQIRPLSDRLLVATTSGRLMCLQLTDGTLIWQTCLARQPIDRLLANEDFTVLRTNEDNGVSLMAIDNYDGQVHWRRSFSQEAGMTPINIALSPDGLLVWLMPDRICAKDLYEPGDEAKFGETPVQPADPNVQTTGLYVGNTASDGLLIAGGRIITLRNGGRFLSIHSCETGAIIGKPLSTNPGPAGRPKVSLRIEGNFLYAVSSKNIIAYNLDVPADINWGSVQSLDQVRETLFGSDYLILADEVGPARRPADAQGIVYRLYAFSRTRHDDAGHMRESGRMDRDTPISDPAGITQWQAADGGIYYLSGDQKLHLLKGGR